MTKMAKIIATIFILFHVCCTSATAANDDFRSANFWLPVCESTRTIDQVGCLSFFRGWMEMLTLLKWKARRDGTSEELDCVPDRATTDENIAIVKEYYIDHPEQRHMPFSLGIYNALHAAFCCK
jgi:hypothetical protein